MKSRSVSFFNPLDRFAKRFQTLQLNQSCIGNEDNFSISLNQLKFVKSVRKDSIFTPLGKKSISIENTLHKILFELVQLFDLNLKVPFGNRTFELTFNYSCSLVSQKITNIFLIQIHCLKL